MMERTQHGEVNFNRGSYIPVFYFFEYFFENSLLFSYNDLNNLSVTILIL